MSADILSIATVEPDHFMSQDKIVEKMIDILSLTGPFAAKLKKIHLNTAIEKRHTVQPIGETIFSRLQAPERLSELNKIYKEEAPKLAFRAAKKALNAWGGSPSDITHVISVSCTGMYAPGIEYLLMDQLHLSRDVGRYGVNFMGCFGAFKALGLADAIAKEDTKHRILIVCTELCSLHIQTQGDVESIVSNALFADGAAAAIVGQDRGLFEIVKKRSFGVPDTQNHMSWDIGDSGFLMRLSKEVPDLLGKEIAPFVETLTEGRKGIDWAIHPGGRAILEQLEKSLQITREQTQASWNTLRNYGNMSSATYLFVLEELLRLGRKHPWCVGLAMGPGLSIEGMLLKTR